MREVWTLFVDHLDSHSHGLWDDENVREDNGCVDESFISFDGLQSQGASDLRRPTAFEEIMIALDFMVFWKVSSRFVVKLAHLS